MPNVLVTIDVEPHHSVHLMKFESVTEDLAKEPVLGPVKLPPNNAHKYERE